MHRTRSSADLHETLTLIREALWNKQVPPAQHLYSVRVRNLKLGSILGDGLAELEARRAAMDTAGLKLSDEWKR